MKLADFVKQHRSFNMSASEKSRLRDDLLAFAKQHPIDDSIHLTKWRAISLATAFAGITVALVVAVFAEFALPGKALYGYKVGVNERVLSYLAFSDEAEGRLMSQLTDRRLTEAEILTVTRTLNDEHKTQLYNLIENNEDKFQSRIDSLISKGEISKALEVQNLYYTNLAAHKAVADSLNLIHTEEAFSSLDRVVSEKLEKYSESNSRLRRTLVTQSSSTVSVLNTRLQQQAESEIRSLENLLEQRQDSWDQQSLTKTRNSLSQAKDYKASADSFSEYEISDTAYEQYQAAINLAKQAELSARQEERLNKIISESQEEDATESEVKGQYSEYTEDTEKKNQEDDTESRGEEKKTESL